MIDTPPTIEVRPSAETLRQWADELVPASDVWFWDDSPLPIDRARCLVMTREEYLGHESYRDIRYVNAYLHWQMPSEVTRVIVTSRAWVGALPHADRRRVLEMQVALKRGLIFSADWFGELPESLQSLVAANQVVLGGAVWARLPLDVQCRALLAEQRRWDDVDCHPVPQRATAHVRAVANTFGPHEGTNCLAIAMYGATGDPGLLTTWMRQPAFLQQLEANGYRSVPGVDPIPNDIVTFEIEGTLVHAAWCVDHDRFLNKNGQSRFNPIRIVDWTMLAADWSNATSRIYRPDLTRGSEVAT